MDLTEVYTLKDPYADDVLIASKDTSEHLWTYAVSTAKASNSIDPCSPIQWSRNTFYFGEANL